jgi:hypothetical protein
MINQCKDVPARETQISQEMGNLWGVIEELEKNLADLSARTQRVRYNKDVEGKTTGCKDVPVNSLAPLAEEIRKARERLQGYNYGLLNLLRELEV